MATPLSNIENGITTGDWKLVCDGYNKLTGKKLSPLVVKKEEKKFDPKTSSKRELYNFMKTKFDIAPIKAYTIEDLREMVLVHSLNQSSTEDVYEDELTAKVEVQKLANGEAFMDGFRYTSGRKELLPMDKLRVRAVLDPLLKDVGDPTNEYVPRDPPKRIEMRCLKCSKKFKNFASLGVESGGELKALCPVCSENV